ncbi:hypothetical protein BHE74_00017041 [Ensete ventricosum]|nr:hypothetical protein BHE74_00017041 [Ensete ventricosum]RZR87555.1 hypothetical protein BHM03_00015003 [Ensete ventricosum]
MPPPSSLAIFLPRKEKDRDDMINMPIRRIPALVLEGGTIFSTRTRLKRGIRRFAIDGRKKKAKRPLMSLLSCLSVGLRELEQGRV